MKGMNAADWRASWRAANVVRRSALLVFAALRRRGLAQFSDREILVVTSFGILHVVPLAALSSNKARRAHTDPPVEALRPSHLPFAPAIQLAGSPPDVVAKRVMLLSVRRDPRPCFVR